MLYGIKTGVKIFDRVQVEDIMVRKREVTDLVINWTAVEEEIFTLIP